MLFLFGNLSASRLLLIKRTLPFVLRVWWVDAMGRDSQFGLVYSPSAHLGLWLLILILFSKEIGIFEVSTDVRLRHKNQWENVV